MALLKAARRPYYRRPTRQLLAVNEAIPTNYMILKIILQTLVQKN
jgi:hypothetical protein